MISILMDAINIGFEEKLGPNGERFAILVASDPQSGIQVRIPFDPESARQIAAHLDGRPTIQVAKKLP